MNFISSQEAVSIFPRSTLLERISYTTNVAKDLNWRNKYIDRGFRVVSSEDRDPTLDPRYGCRFVKDNQCWTIFFASA